MGISSSFPKREEMGGACGGKEYPPFSFNLAVFYKLNERLEKSSFF